MIHINLVVFKTRLVCPPNKSCFQCKEASFEEQTRLLLNRVEYLCFFRYYFVILKLLMSGMGGMAGFRFALLSCLVSFAESVSQTYEVIIRERRNFIYQ